THLSFISNDTPTSVIYTLSLHDALPIYVTEAFWETKNNSLVFTITANRFLRNMVRAIVGTLLDVGQEKIKPEEINTIIQSKQRSDAGKSVAAEGLFLTKIEYTFLKEVKC